jgi:hypothetical protein
MLVLRSWFNVAELRPKKVILIKIALFDAAF